MTMVWKLLLAGLCAVCVAITANAADRGTELSVEIRNQLPALPTVASLLPGQRSDGEHRPRVLIRALTSRRDENRILAILVGREIRTRIAFALHSPVHVVRPMDWIYSEPSVRAAGVDYLLEGDIAMRPAGMELSLILTAFNGAVPPVCPPRGRCTASGDTVHIKAALPVDGFMQALAENCTLVVEALGSGSGTFDYGDLAPDIAFFIDLARFLGSAKGERPGSGDELERMAEALYIQAPQFPLAAFNYLEYLSLCTDCTQQDRAAQEVALQLKGHPGIELYYATRWLSRPTSPDRDRAGDQVRRAASEGGSPFAYAHLIRWLIADGESDAAIVLSLHVAERWPRDFNSWHLLSESLLAHLGNGDNDLQIRGWSRDAATLALQRYPQSTELRLWAMRTIGGLNAEFAARYQELLRIIPEEQRLYQYALRYSADHPAFQQRVLKDAKTGNPNARWIIPLYLKQFTGASRLRAWAWEALLDRGCDYDCQENISLGGWLLGALGLIVVSWRLVRRRRQ